MKLSISTTLFYESHIFDVLSQLTHLSFDGIEQRLKPPHFDYNESQEIKGLRKRAKRAKVSILSVHAPSGIDIASLNEWERVRSVREVQKGIVVAHRVGGKFAVVHPGEERTNGEIQLEMVRRSLDEIVEFSQDWGVKILVENTQPGKIGDSPDEILGILKRYGEREIGFCLDTSHCNLNRIKISEGMKKLSQFLQEIHVSDNLGKRDDHTIPGEGNIDWDDFLDGLSQIGFDGTLCFELMAEEDYVPFVEKIVDIYTEWQEILSDKSRDV
jgi:sugar phosphate isomerase/epimerase